MFLKPLSHLQRSFATPVLATVVLATLFAPPAVASGPPGADWKETQRYIIFRDKKTTIWLIWYRKEARMVSQKRMNALGMADVLKYLADLEGQEEVASIVKGLGRMSDTELRGFAHVCRRYNRKENTTREFEDVLDLPPPFRNHVFHLAGEISEQCTIGKGLANAVDRGLVANNEANQMGLIGQLRAAQQYVKNLADAGFKKEDIVIDFEAPKWVGRKYREVDFRVTVKGRQTDVEVKTNMGSNPSVIREQIRKDILSHIPDDWSLLLYLYPTVQEDNIQRVHNAFLKEFDAIVADVKAKRIPNPFPKNRTPAEMREILKKKLPSLVTTFDLPDLKRKK